MNLCPDDGGVPGMDYQLRRLVTNTPDSALFFPLQQRPSLRRVGFSPPRQWPRGWWAEAHPREYQAAQMMTLVRAKALVRLHEPKRLSQTAKR
jgi:hypothetical protein